MQLTLLLGRYDECRPPLSSELQVLERTLAALVSRECTEGSLRSSSEIVRATLSALGVGFNPGVTTFSHVSAPEINDPLGGVA